MRLSVLAFAVLAASGAAAQTPAPLPPAPIAGALPGMGAPAKLTVTAKAFKAGDMVPLANTGYGQSLSPALSWSHGPAATKSYLLLLEDSDTNFHGIPVTHWLAYNIPADVTALPGALPPQGPSSEPAGMIEGRNVRGTLGYVGPRPGHDPHHYHFQIFALDIAMPTPGQDRNTAVAAASGHVLAVGDLVVLSVAPPGVQVGPPPAAAPPK